MDFPVSASFFSTVTSAGTSVFNRMKNSGGEADPVDNTCIRLLPSWFQINRFSADDPSSVFRFTFTIFSPSIALDVVKLCAEPSFEYWMSSTAHFISKLQFSSSALTFHVFVSMSYFISTGAAFSAVSPTNSGVTKCFPIFSARKS